MLMAVRTDDRDGRALSHMDAETKEVHAHLERWARWVKNALSDLQLPGVTYLHRWSEYGPITPQGGWPNEMPDDIAVTDAGVARLCQIDQRVVKAYYCQWAPREALARNCGMRLREFDSVLKRARWRIAFYRLGALDQSNLIPQSN